MRGFLITGGAAVVLLAGMAASGIIGLGSAGGAPLIGGDLLTWIVAEQRAFHQELTGLLASLKEWAGRALAVAAPPRVSDRIPGRAEIERLVSLTTAAE